MSSPTDGLPPPPDSHAGDDLTVPAARGPSPPGAGSPGRGPSPSDPNALPERIGQYTIRRRIATGGMGTVYEAVQEHPRRTVAVKVMKPGIVSPGTLRRFEYEAQLLARLRHPGIAQVYEAGTHEDAAGVVPFFAMEYIPNAKPITQYANEKKLGIRERLEIFARVCDAVHHGHQKGIVHRDLKPSNIIVDSSAQPRVIDFGVARATDSDMALATLQTEVGQLIGSLQYMSPEQFDADPHDIDTRSDVYALGVVLYELLCGELPYDVGSLSIFDAARVVREDQPTRPGTSSAELRGEPETIVLKAMEKDRDRRYQSAFGLAQDIRRYLNGEAILAKPPSIVYQFRVFARRNKVLLGAVAAVFVVLLAGVAVSTSMYLRAESQRALAEEESAKKQSAVDFLRMMLATTAPEEYGRMPTIADLLERTSQRASMAFPDEPEVEADIHHTIGLGYLNLHRLRPAQENVARALEIRQRLFGEYHPATLAALEDHALLGSIAGGLEESLEARRSIVRIRTKLYGEDHEGTRAAAASLTQALLAAGRLKEAEESALRVLEVCRRTAGDEDPETLEARLAHAWMRQERHAFAEAETLSREVLEIARRNLGDDHEVTRGARANVAAALISQGRVDEAAHVYGDRRVPDDLGIEKFFQGTYRPSREGTQVLVFWETWCPFSQRAIPGLEKVHRRYGKELQFVGLSEVDRNSTEEKVRAFIAEKGLTFPMAKEDGTAKRFFAVQGTPWVCIVRDGSMVWENYVLSPELISNDMLEGLVRVAAK